MANKSWDEDREKLRALLKDLRKDAGLTQVELSNALGKPQSYVSKYETGERKLDYVEINDICKVLGVSMEKFNKLYEKKRWFASDQGVWLFDKFPDSVSLHPGYGCLQIISVARM